MGGIKMQRDETVLAVGIVEATRRLGFVGPHRRDACIAPSAPEPKGGPPKIIPAAALEALMQHGDRTSQTEKV
jgi:hypothetical protein